MTKLQAQTSPLQAKQPSGALLTYADLSSASANQSRVVALMGAQNRVLEMIATVISLQDILSTLALIVEEQAPGTLCSILLLDKDGKRLRTGAAPTLSESYSKAIDGTLIGPCVGSCGTAAFRREAVMVSDIEQSPLWADYIELARMHGLRACWSIPIFSPHGDLFGTFALYHREPHTPTPDDVSLIEAITPLAGIAIERYRVEQALRRQKEELTALHETTLGLINRLDTTELLESIVARAAALMDTHHGYLYVVEPGTGHMVIRVGVGIFADRLGYQLNYGEGLSGRIWATGQPIALEDYQNWPDKRLNFDQLHAIAGIPLRAGGEIVGVLGLAYPEDWRTFGPDELTLLTRFGQLASLALDNARLFTKAQQDLLARMQTDEALRASERRYRHLFERNLAGVYRSTADGRFLDCNDALVRILGCDSRDDLMGRLASEFYWDPGDRTDLLSDLRQQHSIKNSEIRLKRKDGSPLWVLDSATLVEEVQNGVVVMEGTLIDITDRKVLEDQLLHQAFHDPLTGLPNRALFMDRLDHALARVERVGGTVAVLFLDMDEFKVTNDSLGHKVGDSLLIAVGGRIAGALRLGDTVARLGGDEFTVLLERIVAVEEAIEVAERVAEALKTPFHIDGHDIFISTSVGIALSATDQSASTDLLRNADIAMYEAKKGGRARYALFEQGMNSRLWERIQVEADLRRALDQGEFTIHYQPVVQLDNGRLRELEALVRWNHPTKGLVPPAEFVHIAEESGLILPLGEWVLREACRQMHEWHTSGFGELPSDDNAEESSSIQPETRNPRSTIVVSVNLSARQFRQPRLVEDIVRILTETGLDPCYLKLEITESVALDNTASTIATLRELRRLGIHIAVDDFGTGYSALSYLKRYPVDTLKLDRSFVEGMFHDFEDTAIVHAVIAFAKTLSLSVTAEGIETVEQLSMLQSLGCDRGQGFYFAKPMSASAVTTLLAADGNWGAEQWCLLPKR